MNPTTRLLLVTGTSLSLMIGCGDGGSGQEFGAADLKPADPTAHKHDHSHGDEHDAPHGGSLIALGEHAYHAEIVWDDDTHSITAYILDGEAKSPVGIAAKELVLVIGDGDKAKRHPLTAKPQQGDADGKASRFVVTDEELFEKFHDDDTLAGQIDVAIGEKNFSFVVAHQHDHDHDHDHDHKKGDEAKKK
ncbi:MAG: hypothetical protein CMJ65_13270 [Planctomycetaceae bacterium]|nr:hypothetical protein [Planctomycetaceae bacterium]